VGGAGEDEPLLGLVDARGGDALVGPDDQLLDDLRGRPELGREHAPGLLAELLIRRCLDFLLPPA
jgi:hypothetical protein